MVAAALLMSSRNVQAYTEGFPQTYGQAFPHVFHRSVDLQAGRNVIDKVTQYEKLMVGLRGGEYLYTFARLTSSARKPKLYVVHK